MSRLSVSIDANAAGFNAAISSMVASARAGATSIKSSLNGSMDIGGAGGAARTAVTNASQKLVKARQAEAAIARQVAIAEQKVAEVRRVGATSLAAQTAAESRAVQARIRQRNIQRDAANELLKARQAEDKALRQFEVAEQRQIEMERAIEQGRRVRASTILATNKAVIDSEEAYTQAARKAELAEATGHQKSGKAAADRLIAERRLAEAMNERTVAQSRVMSADNAYANAQTKHVHAVRATEVATAELARAQRVASTATGQLGAAVQAVNRGAIDGVGNSMLKTGAVAAIGVGLVAKAAIDWQKNWTEVTKTVDFSKSSWDSQTEALAANEQGLRNLTKVIPLAHAEIAQTASMLGTLGVGADDLVSFTKVASQLGTVTSLSSEEAATSLTQLMTVTGEAPSQINKLGSALVALSLDGASTERQILQTGLRIGSAGKSVGFAAEDTLALGSALGSVGIQAEAGGNNMATTLTKIDRAVRSGGDGLQKYADLTGMTADQFKTAWGKDAPEALALVLDGLGNLSSSGGNVTDMLRSMGIVNIREIRNMRDLALATKAGGGQMDLYRDQLRLAREEREKGTKLDETANKTYQTDAAKITLALNSINDAAIDTGGALLPAIAGIADGIAQAADSFGKLDPAMQGFVIKGAAMAAVGLLAGGAMLKLGAGVIGAVQNLQSLGVSMSTITGTAGKLGIAVAGVTAALVGVNAVGNYGDKLNALKDPAKQTAAALDQLAKSGDPAKINKVFELSGAQGNKTGDLALYNKDILSLSDAFKRLDDTGSTMAGRANNINDFFTAGLEALGGAKGTRSLLEERVAGVDSALAQMATSGNAEQAGKAFEQLAANSGQSVDQLLPKFGGYREALAEVAESTYKVTLTQQELTDWMSGKVPAAISQSSAGMLQGATASDQLRIKLIAARSALEEMQLGTARTAEESTKLAQTLFVQGNAFQQAQATHVGFAEAVDQSTEVLKKNGVEVNKSKTELGDNTKVGRENITVLQNLATTGKGWIESLVLQGKGSKRVKEATKEVRGEFVKAAEDAGLSTKAAGKLADSYGLIPKEVSTKISTFMEAANESRMASYRAQIDELPPEVKTKLYAIVEKEGADAGLKFLQEELAKLNGTTAKPTVDPDVKEEKLTEVDQKLVALAGTTYNPHVAPKVDNKPLEDVDRKLMHVDELRPTPKVTVKADTKGADQADAAVKKPKDREVKVTTKADTKGAKEAETVTKGAKDKTIKITVKANTAGAKSIQDAISGAKNKTIRITIKANTGGAKNVADAISGVKSKTITVKIKGDTSGAKNVADAVSGVKSKSVKVTVTGSNAGATSAKKAIDDVKGKSVKVTVGADTSGASRAKSAIASVNSKTVYITTVTKTVKKATGGLVLGAGTGTSDSIPAMLSNGEYVLRAAAVKSIGVGYLEYLNAKGYAMGGLVGGRQKFASGGPVGTPSINAKDYAAIVALIRALTNPVAAVNAARARVTAATPAATADKAALERIKKRRIALQDEAIKDRKAAEATKGKTKADKEYAKTRRELAAINTAYSRASDKAGKSSQKLKEATDALTQANKELSDASRQVSTELSAPYRSTSNDIEDWLDQMRTGKTDLVAFQAQIVKLRQQGLNETTIQAISAKGAINGAEVAAQVIAGGKAMVDALNTANAGLQKAADDIGYVTASGVGRYATGGVVVGPGTGTSDSVPLRASAGEYLVNARATAMNRGLLDMINYGTRQRGNDFMPHYATGGLISRPAQHRTEYHAGDVNLYGVIGDPDQWLRKAQQSKHDSQVMFGLTRQFV